MTDEESQEEDLQLTEDQEEEKALEQMEENLKDMRGVETLDDDDEDHNDEEEKAPDEESAKPDEDAGVSAEAGEVEASESEGEDKSGGDEPEPDGEVAEVDDDKLAESMNEKTGARFQHFREENKRITEEYEQVNGQFEQLKTSTESMNHYINDSQITPEQLSTALSMAKAINTGDYEIARPAFERLKAQMNQVAIGLGDQSADVQFTAEEQQNVDNLDITPELARRNAIATQQQAQFREHQQGQFQQQQQYDQNRQVATQGAGAVKQWEDQMVTKDPDFGAKRELMMDTSKQIMQNYHPSQWAAELNREYEAISRAMNRSAEQQQRASAKNQGIRPSATSGGTSHSEPAAKTFEDHMDREYRRLAGQGRV